MDLPSDCKFFELQALISSAVQVPPNRQRIRFGFPPRELKPPDDTTQDFKVPVQPGDKIMVDVIADENLVNNDIQHGEGNCQPIGKSPIILAKPSF